MIFYFDEKGNLIKSLSENVYQGSKNANTIYFVSNVESTNFVKIAFNLPSGQAVEKINMSLDNDVDLSNFYDFGGESYNVWKYSVSSVITNQAGVVTVQFFVENSDNVIVSSASSRFEVIKGVDFSDNGEEGGTQQSSGGGNTQGGSTPSGGGGEISQDISLLLNDYAKKDGFYEEFGYSKLAGNLKNRDASKEFVTFDKRTVGGNEDVGTGNAKISKIYGKTVCLNQLIEDGNFDNQDKWDSYLATLTLSNNTATYTPMMEDMGATYFGVKDFIDISSNRKYLLMADIRANTTAPVSFIVRGPSSNVEYIHCTVDTNWKTYGGVVFLPHSTRIKPRIAINDEHVYTVEVKHFQLIDLSKMFGYGYEPATVEEFKESFNKSYYEYTTGTIKNVSTTKIKSVGFNAYNNRTGKASIIAFKKYKIEGDYTSLSFKDKHENTLSVTVDENGYFTTNEDCELSIEGGNENNTCVHLVWSGYRDNEFAPYKESVLTLDISTYFPNGMGGIGDVCDELYPDKAIKRINSRPRQSGDENDLMHITDGTTTYYIMANPVVTPISVPLNLEYYVEDFGTEEIDEQSAPISFDATYVLNAVDSIRRLPNNYISKKSFDNIVSALSSIGISLTLTYNEKLKQYTATATDAKAMYLHTIKLNISDGYILIYKINTRSTKYTTYGEIVASGTNSIISGCGREYTAGSLLFYNNMNSSTIACWKLANSSVSYFENMPNQILSVDDTVVSLL